MNSIEIGVLFLCIHPYRPSILFMHACFSSVFQLLRLSLKLLPLVVTVVMSRYIRQGGRVVKVMDC